MRALRVVAIVVAVAALSGCSVPVRGMLGFMQTEDGKIQAIVKMCEGSVDRLKLYVGGGPDQMHWEFDAPVADIGTVDLIGIDELRGESTYDSYAWSTRDESMANGPRLTLDLLDSLEPGQILAPGGAPSYSSVMTEDEFEAQADAVCG